MTFTIRPTNDSTAEGDETITVSGNVAGLSVLPAELLLRDDDDASTRVDLSLSPPSVSEGVASAEVRVTGRLNDGARPDETVVALTVGEPDDTAVVNSDYAGVIGPTLTIPPNETTAETTFTLFPEDDGIAEGASRSRSPARPAPDREPGHPDPVGQRHAVTPHHAVGRPAVGSRGERRGRHGDRPPGCRGPCRRHHRAADGRCSRRHGRAGYGLPRSGRPGPDHRGWRDGRSALSAWPWTRLGDGARRCR